MANISSPYDLITISIKDLESFEEGNKKSKIWLLLNLVLDELPKNLKKYRSFIEPCLVPIEGFEDNEICGYELKINPYKKIDNFVKGFIPFFILLKED